MDNYHNSVISLKESISDNELQAKLQTQLTFISKK